MKICKICAESGHHVPAIYIAQQSYDDGRTIRHLPVCADHAVNWVEGASWACPKPTPIDSLEAAPSKQLTRAIFSTFDEGVNTCQRLQAKGGTYPDNEFSLGGVCEESLERIIKAHQQKTIQIWAWDDAPAEYKALSGHGGDEDWVAFIPDHYESAFIGFLEQGSSFGCYDVLEYPVNGGVIRIGAHA